MPGDRARVSYDPSRKWRGVVAQQGRVTVEADWNEAAAIGEERDRQVTLDVVGPVGTPDGGYAVTAVPATGQAPATGDLTIGPGTLYLRGERLDLDQPVTYSTQPDWLDCSTDPLWTTPAVPTADVATHELVYLLASEQEVSAVEDPALADVALGGPDTMQRQRILQHFVRQPSQSAACDGASQELESSLAGQGLRFDAASMRVESATTLQVSFTDPTGATGPCQPVATGGYLGAENQMIRVMVTGVERGAPTIAWGFDDASFLYRLTAATCDSASGNTKLTLGSAPVDSYHSPAAGQAVELLRGAVQLTPTDYIASPYGYVSALTAAYDPAQMQLVMSGQPPAGYLSTAPPQQLFLRVWQETVAAPAGQATPLGDTGVAVTLRSGGSFHPGDFWRFALRPIQPTIVYPARYLTAAQPPDGPRTWACPLAVLTWQDGSATATSCVPPFSGLVKLTAAPTAGQGGCCTVDIGPSDVDGGGSLPQLLGSYANQGPVTVCLKPGTYTLPAPLMLGPELGHITLQSCGEGVVLQAPGQPGAEFVHGLITMQEVNAVTIRGIQLSVPLVSFSPSPDSFSGLLGTTRGVLEAFARGLQVGIGISVDGSAGLIVENCTFEFPDPGTANTFGAGIFATGAMDGAEVTGCTFRSARPPSKVPFYDLAVGNETEPPYQLTFGYLQLPLATPADPDEAASRQLASASAKAAGQRLHDAAIERCVFQGMTVATLAVTQLGTLRVDKSTARSSYGGFWFLSLTDQTWVTVLDVLAGHAQAYQELGASRAAPMLDPVVVIATGIARVLPAAPPAGEPAVPGKIPTPSTAQLTLARHAFSAIVTKLPPAIDAIFTKAGAPGSAAPIPVADPATSVSLRFDLCDCQIDSAIGDSYSGAGLFVADLATGTGSALLHGSRIRSRFPGGAAAFAVGLGEAAVTGNIMANEVGPPQGTESLSLNSYSLVVFPASTSLDTSPGGPAVAITGNVFIDDFYLASATGEITQWNVLNTVIPYVAPGALA